jgi:hypothetical protein
MLNRTTESAPHTYKLPDLETCRGWHGFVARLPWARTDRLQQLYSLLWLLCVFNNLGNLLFAQS